MTHELSHVDEFLARFINTGQQGPVLLALRCSDSARYKGEYGRSTRFTAHAGPSAVKLSGKNVWAQEVIEVKKRKVLRQGVEELETLISQKDALNFSQASTDRRVGKKSEFNGDFHASRNHIVEATIVDVPTNLSEVEEQISKNVSDTGSHVEGKDVAGENLPSSGLPLGKELDKNVLSHEINGVNGNLLWLAATIFSVKLKIAKKVVHMFTNQYKHHIHACDTEVSKIDVKQDTPVNHGEIICFSIYSGEEVDFGNGKSCIWVDVLDSGGKDILAEFAPFFEDESIKKVWHNYSFDCHVIENYGIKISGFHADTMHMARLWDSSRRTNGGYSLEALTSDPKVMFENHFRRDDDLIGKISMKTIFGRRKTKKTVLWGKLLPFLLWRSCRD